MEQLWPCSQHHCLYLPFGRNDVDPQVAMNYIE
jgi:hypothetical protein